MHIAAVLVHGYFSHTLIGLIVNPENHHRHMLESKLWVTNHPMDNASRPINRRIQAMIVLQSLLLLQSSRKSMRATPQSFQVGVVRDFFGPTRLHVFPINFEI